MCIRDSSLPRVDAQSYEGGAYLGIDAGSTTTKVVLITEDGGILYDYYASNKGNPVTVVKEQLEKIFALCGDRITIRGSGATGSVSYTHLDVYKRQE